MFLFNEELSRFRDNDNSIAWGPVNFLLGKIWVEYNSFGILTDLSHPSRFQVVRKFQVLRAPSSLQKEDRGFYCGFFWPCRNKSN